MLYLAIKTIISALLIVAISELARRSAALGALVASLPLVSLLGMIWLWRDTHDPARLADHAQATFWYVLPSLPMFLLIPVLLRAGVSFPLTIAAAILLTAGLYLITVSIAARFGVTL
jgi:hypothetical protein